MIGYLRRRREARSMTGSSVSWGTRGATLGAGGAGMRATASCNAHGNRWMWVSIVTRVEECRRVVWTTSGRAPSCA